jgi:hypothetical protein
MSLCDEIFQIDPNIRFVAHLNKDMKLTEMKMRSGVKSLTNEKTDEEFFSIIEPIVLGACGKLENGFGELRTIRVKYERGSIVFLRVHDEMVGMSLNPGPTTPVIAKIGAKYGMNFE